MNKTIPLLLISLFLLSSCTKVIDIDLNSSNPQIIVEANFSPNENAIVKLTESVNFDNDNVFPLIENATVSISDDFSNSELLTETSPGVYESLSLEAVIGRSYSLLIETNANILSSMSSIPEQVEFDSLIVYQNTSGTGGPGGGEGTTHDIFVQYTDPVATNYYRFVEYKNGEYKNSFVFDDKLANGESNSNALLSFDRNYNTGDTLLVEMQCIDKNVYEYYRSFGNLGDGPGGSTPANPYTNVEGTELGYFSAHTTQLKIIIIE